MTTAVARRVDPRSDPAWEALAGARGSLFTSPPWIRAVCGTYGFEPEARVHSDPSGYPVAGFTWVDVHDLRGRRRMSLPFSDRADPIAADLTEWSGIAADALVDDTPLVVRCLEGTAAEHDRRLVRTATAAWHETSLDGDAEWLYERLRPSVRRNIAAARRGGVRVEMRSDLDAVRTFHRLHVRLRKRKYRLLAQPVEFFERIWHEFAPCDAVRTAIASVAGRPVAGAVYLVWEGVLYYKFGASAPEYLSLRPNDAVHWAALQWAIGRGLRVLDWGLSDLGQQGLVAYKRKWASIERRIVTLRSRDLPDDRAAGRTLGELTRLLTTDDVPDAITERAGALLYRNFS